MISKTRGIVLHNIKYSDSSVISHIYTENYGRHGFLISGVRGKKSTGKINLLQHLSILEMEIYYKQKRDLQRVKEIRVYEQLLSLPYDPVKSAIGLFISEVLYRTIQEHEPNSSLFSFLLNSIKILDLSDESVANFHLVFLLNYSRYLGIFPQNNFSPETPLFDQENGRFAEKVPLHKRALDNSDSEHLSMLLDCSYETATRVKLNGEIRSRLCKGILDYYLWHLPGTGNIKSFQVLRELF